jgi:hypothetical protein
MPTEKLSTEEGWGGVYEAAPPEPFSPAGSSQRLPCHQAGGFPNASWFVLNGVRVIEGGTDEERSIAVLIDVEEELRGDIDQETIEARAWAQDVEWILEVLAAGHDVWAAMNCDRS